MKKCGNNHFFKTGICRSRKKSYLCITRLRQYQLKDNKPPMRAARQPTWGAFFIYNSISSGIPFGEDMADIRKWPVEAFAEDYGILLKARTGKENP